MTKRDPFWLQWDGERWKTIPEAVAVVERAFLLAKDGMGSKTICRLFEDEGVPTFTSGRWHPNTIRRLLENREVLGEKVGRRTDGPPFPLIITAALFNAVQGGRVFRDPTGDWANLFDGLIVCAYCEKAMGLRKGKYRKRRLVCDGAARRASACENRSFPHKLVERTLLEVLEGLQASDLAPSKVEMVAFWGARVEYTKRKLDIGRAACETNPSQAGFALLAEYESELQDYEAQLERAQAAAVSAESESQEATKSILAMYRDAIRNGQKKRPLRLKLRSSLNQLLRRILVKVYDVVLDEGRERWFVAQIEYQCGVYSALWLRTDGRCVHVSCLNAMEEDGVGDWESNIPNGFPVVHMPTPWRTFSRDDDYSRYMPPQ